MIYNHFCNPSTDAKSNRTGIQLLGVVVANRLPPYDPSTAGAIDEKKFYTTFVSLMSHKYKEIYAAAAEVLGMILAVMDDNNHVCIVLCAMLLVIGLIFSVYFKLQMSLDNVRELVNNQLLSLCSGGNEDKFLICLSKIQISFPRLLDR